MNKILYIAISCFLLAQGQVVRASEDIKKAEEHEYCPELTCYAFKKACTLHANPNNKTAASSKALNYDVVDIQDVPRHAAKHARVSQGYSCEENGTGDFIMKHYYQTGRPYYTLHVNEALKDIFKQSFFDKDVYVHTTSNSMSLAVFIQQPCGRFRRREATLQPSKQ